MSEEEILKYLYYFTSSNIKNKKLSLQDLCGFNLGYLNVETLQKSVEGLVVLYEKEQEKNEELEEYANWHIKHLSEDIADYIDDDRKGNASIIGEFKEEREHWKDIIRIINNEKTYIDYKNY